MPGANYMGGRINTAKARVRDADGRMQRDHFGRQKFTVLSKGLGHAGGDRHTTRPLRRDDAISKITLAHAQRAGESSSRHPPVDTMDYRLNAHRLDASTPPPKRRKVDADKFSAESSVSTESRRKVRSSRLLKELDLSEPLCMRAEISRILGCPDFAGLSQNLRPMASMQSSPPRSITPELQDDHASTMRSSLPPSVRSVKSSRPSTPSGCLDPPFSPIKTVNTRDLSTRLGSFLENNAVQDFQNNYRYFSEDEAESPFFYKLPARLEHEASPYADSIIFGSDATAVSSSPYRLPSDLNSEISDSTTFSHSTGYLASSELHVDPDQATLLLQQGEYSQTFQDCIESSFDDQNIIRSNEAPGTNGVVCPRSPPAPMFGSGDVYLFDASTGEYSSGVHLADFPPFNLQTPFGSPSDILVQETLFDSVNGHLFERSDPWATIKARLNLSSSNSDLEESSETFMELTLANDRTGVGYNLSATANESTYSPVLHSSPEDSTRTKSPSVSTCKVPVSDSIGMAQKLSSEAADFPVRYAHTPVKTLIPVSFRRRSLSNLASLSPARTQPPATPLASNLDSINFLPSFKPDTPIDANAGRPCYNNGELPLVVGPSIFFDHEDGSEGE